MESYFFVPATKLNKISNLTKLNISEFIIDFEDAIKASERELLFQDLNNINKTKECFIRVPLHELSFEENLDLDFLKKFINKGYKKFVLPKIKNLKELDVILKQFKSEDLKYILLIETPRTYLEFLNSFNKYGNKLFGIGLGSHDFMSIVGGKHILQNLETIRQNILFIARALNIVPIDIASMELKNDEAFKQEVIDGFNKGFDAKFIIHPKQYEIINNTNFYTEEEYNLAIKIKEELLKLKNKKEFNPIVIEGKIIEQPHIQRAEKIIKNYKK